MDTLFNYQSVADKFGISDNIVRKIRGCNQKKVSFPYIF